MTQAEEGMKLFEAQQGTAAEVDKVGPCGAGGRQGVGKTWQNDGEN